MLNEVTHAVFTSFTPILRTISSTSFRGTFILSRYETPSNDDIGVTTKSSVTIIVNGLLTNPPEREDSGSINSKGTKPKSVVNMAVLIGNIWFLTSKLGKIWGLLSLSLSSCDLKHLSGLNSVMLLYKISMQLKEDNPSSICNTPPSGKVRKL